MSAGIPSERITHVCQSMGTQGHSQIVFQRSWSSEGELHINWFCMKDFLLYSIKLNISHYLQIWHVKFHIKKLLCICSSIFSFNGPKHKTSSKKCTLFTLKVYNDGPWVEYDFKADMHWVQRYLCVCVGVNVEKQKKWNACKCMCLPLCYHHGAAMFSRLSGSYIQIVHLSTLLRIFTFSLYTHNVCTDYLRQKNTFRHWTPLH